MWERIRERLDKYRKYRAMNGCTCDHCGREIFTYPRQRLCDNCLEKLPETSFSCPKCGRKTGSEGVCLNCKARMPQFSFALSAFPYEGICASLINRFKNGSAYLAYFFAEAIVPVLHEALRQKNIDIADCILTCVPDRKEGRRSLRGRRYNPAEELLKRVCEVNGAEYDGEIMAKSRETSPQKRMNAKERFENVRGAYRVHKRKACEGKTVLVFDDILTTGATGDECARVLLAAGAKRVIFVTAVTVPERKDFPEFAD